MKNTVFIACVLFGSTQLLAQTPSVSEEEAIKKVIIDESTAWAKRDTTAYFEAFAKNDITQGAWNNRNLSYGVYSGFETLQKSVRENIKSNPTPSYGTNMERTNWLIKLLSPEQAWVNYTQKTTTLRGIINTSYETRLMHKEDGKWRINVVNALWDYKNVVYPTPNPEEEDIKKVIIEESRDFRRGNLVAFMGAYANAPHLLWTVTNGMEPGDVLTFRGYDALKSFSENLPWFKAFKPEDAQKLVSDALRDNWNFQLRSNIAIVNFDEHWIDEKAKTKMTMTVLKVLEKINGQWKLITTSALADFKDATPPIKSKY